ncbi:MAG: hypothetical protein WD316_12735 [Phycisphaeraceae bacterium]
MPDPAPADRIGPDDDHPWYWRYRGEPVLLVGASGEDNLFNHLVLENETLEAHLDRLVDAGGNYIRNTMSDRDPGNVYAFARDGDRFDLRRFDDAYFQRLETLLRLAFDRGIIVQLELWDMWDLTLEPWSRHPFNPRNNINYTAELSSLPEVVGFEPAMHPTSHGFFHTVPPLENNGLLLEIQQAWVDRVLDVTLDYPNVLYCMNNESGEPAEWSRHWAMHTRRRAAERGLSVHTADMRRHNDIMHDTHRTVYDDTQAYSFVDVSQNTGYPISDRGLQYRRLLEARDYLAPSPRPINCVKIYGDHFGAAPKLMRNLFAGLASSRFHRPPRGPGLNHEAAAIIASVRKFTSELDWFRCAPAPELLSHGEGVYLMAEPGRQYALAFDGPGRVELDLRDLPGPAELRWMKLHKGKWVRPQRVEPGVQTLETPGDALWLAMVRVA